ncbi:MAG: twin-arginine translocase subunit TatC [Chloroflexota bacterium]
MKNFFRKIFRIIFAPFRWLKKLFNKTPLGQLLGPDPEDTPITETISKAVDSPRSFWEGLIVHLVDLRKAVFKSVASALIFSVVAFVFIEDIMAWLAIPLGGNGVTDLKAIEVTEAVGTVMRIAFMTGLAVSLPYIFFQILAFVGPGITRKARLTGLLGLPFVLVFFVGGAYFAYSLMLGPALEVLTNFMGIQAELRPQSYFKFVTGLMFWIGFCFEFPLIAFFLSSMGILKPETLVKQWRLALILLTILAAMITPTVDPWNMIIVLVPLWALYGLSILMAFVARGRKTTETED